MRYSDVEVWDMFHSMDTQCDNVQTSFCHLEPYRAVLYVA